MGVNSAMYTAITGLNAFGTALGVVSDNIANSASTAYKSNTARFGDLVSGYYATQSSDPESQGVGTTMLGVTTDLTTGTAVSTGTWSNVMLQGDGFFSVENSGGSILYTRDGTFTVDADGYLVDLSGNQVQGYQNDPTTYETTGNEADNTIPPTATTATTAIMIDDPSSGTYPKYSAYEVDEQGIIWGTLTTPIDIYATPGDPTTAITGQVSKEPIGQLAVTTFSNPEGLVRNGSNTYYAGGNAGVAKTSYAGEGQAGECISGAIEASNVDLADQMVNMIIYQADYTANTKAISTASNMLDTVVNLIR
ncbi:MAG: flagellar hook basal-body protein [Syntrophobacter sp.]